MKVITHSVKIEVNSDLEEKTARAVLDNYHLTAGGIQWIDVEYNKPFSLFKSTLQKLVKRIPK